MTDDLALLLIASAGLLVFGGGYLYAKFVLLWEEF